MRVISFDALTLLRSTTSFSVLGGVDLGVSVVLTGLFVAEVAGDFFAGFGFVETGLVGFGVVAVGFTVVVVCGSSEVVLSIRAVLAVVDVVVEIEVCLSVVAAVPVVLVVIVDVVEVVLVVVVVAVVGVVVVVVVGVVVVVVGVVVVVVGVVVVVVGVVVVVVGAVVVMAGVVVVVILSVVVVVGVVVAVVVGVVVVVGVIVVVGVVVVVDVVENSDLDGSLFVVSVVSGAVFRIIFSACESRTLFTGTFKFCERTLALEVKTTVRPGPESYTTACCTRFCIETLLVVVANAAEGLPVDLTLSIFLLAAAFLA